MNEDAAVVCDQIVAAASQLFLRSGYEDVSTEEIARSVGRSKKTLYKHFATKQDLLHAVLARVDGTLQSELDALVAAAGGDRLAALRAALLAVARRLVELQRGLLTGLHSSEPALGSRCWHERRLAVGRLLQPILAAATADGLLRQDVDADGLMAVFVGAVEGLARAADAEDRLPVLVSLLVDGLRRA